MTNKKYFPDVAWNSATMPRVINVQREIPGYSRFVVTMTRNPGLTVYRINKVLHKRPIIKTDVNTTAIDIRHRDYASVHYRKNHTTGFCASNKIISSCCINM